MNKPNKRPCGCITHQGRFINMCHSAKELTLEMNYWRHSEDAREWNYWREQLMNHTRQ